MRHAAAVALALAFALPFAPVEARADFRGNVVSVADGDTVTVLVGRTEIHVRLAGIDAPERGQPYATASRQSLASMVARRSVLVVERGRDRYGRVLGEMRADEVDVNAEQVRRGYAWVYRRYSRDPRMLSLEGEARAAGRGLWRDPRPVPPWDWRAAHDASRSAAH